jgi:hypothetical protein
MTPNCLREGCEMSEGEAFVNPMAAYLVQSGFDDPNPKETEPDPRRQVGVVARSLFEILAAVAASAIVVFMVARAGMAAGHDANAATLISGSMTAEPDPLTVCSEVRGEMVCVREAT